MLAWPAKLDLTNLSIPGLAPVSTTANGRDQNRPAAKDLDFGTAADQPIGGPLGNPHLLCNANLVAIRRPPAGPTMIPPAGSISNVRL